MKIKYVLLFVILLSIDLMVNAVEDDESGYIFILPEFVDMSQQTRDSGFYFSIGYCPSKNSTYTELIRLNLYDPVTCSKPNWLTLNYSKKEISFIMDNIDASSSIIYSVSLSDEIAVTLMKKIEHVVYNGWQFLNDDRYILFSNNREENSKPEFISVDLTNGLKVLPATIEELMAPTNGRFSKHITFGGLYLSWSPKKDLYFFSYPETKVAKLKHLPPKELYEDKENSRWRFFGNNNETFSLLSNPSYYEAEKKVKSRIGIYLHELKKWEIIDLDGTECNQVFFEDALVIQEGNMSPDSRPEKHFGYLPIITGNYILIDLKTSKRKDFKLSPNADILFASSSILVVKENNAIYEISWDEANNLLKKELCTGSFVDFVQFAIPAKTCPKVKKDFLLITNGTSKGMWDIVKEYKGERQRPKPIYIDILNPEE